MKQQQHRGSMEKKSGMMVKVAIMACAGIGGRNGPITVIGIEINRRPNVASMIASDYDTLMIQELFC